MKTIAIDMDEVMADQLQKVITTFNERFDKSLTKEDVIGTRIIDLYPHLIDEIYQFLNEPDFFRDLQVMDHCQDTIFELSQHYEIIIATAAMEVPGSFHAKYAWLKEHFGFLNDQHFVFCGDKRVIQADYLIDDNLYQLQRFTNQGILFTAPHNMNIDYDNRVNHWLEVKEYFMSVLV